ncbi:MAG TPA: hypothetical protein VHD32_05220 [Candidatus Didemnitutus sp.]|nr:hypothetical protein [Candidatus Didemnitutus sp.]
MNPLEGLLLLVAVMAGTLVSGYSLAAFLADRDPSVRLSVACLAGISLQLLAVSALNLVVPLSPAWSPVCLVPIGVTLGWSRVRRMLWSDLVAVMGDRAHRWIIALAVAFLIALLLPMLANPQTAFYDGTSNHDSFFWISGAEYLKRHTYLAAPTVNAAQPLGNNALAITGLEPAWGRMGAEGLLALTSSLAWTSPLKLYLYATAALFLPWISAVFLAVRTFWSARVPLIAFVVIAGLEPVFLFYFANANLPNLVGAISGATVIVSAECILRGNAGRLWGAWWWLLVLSAHGLACSYPEMLPFVALPAALLAVRSAIVRGRTAWPGLASMLLAVAVAAVVNPATSQRALHGFFESYVTARANQNWTNLFENIDPMGFVPALGTLSVPAVHMLGDFGGLAVTLLVVVTAMAAWWRTEDRFGSFAVFAGALALVVYTLATGFTYGWQKSVQFSGVFVAAAPAAALATAIEWARGNGWRRWAGRAGATGVILFLGFSLLSDFSDNLTWSTRKALARDWFNLRELSQTEWRGQPVLVEAASFRMSFFYSMWSAYFLPESPLGFAARGHQPGGYLRDTALHEGHDPLPPAKGFLVGRAWAESFDANSPRILAGREYALIARANRVTDLTGVYPLEGPPDYADPDITLEVTPHHSSTFSIELMPRKSVIFAPGRWHLWYQAGHAPAVSTELAGPPPWRLSVPLVANERNRVKLKFDQEMKFDFPYPLIVERIRIEDAP